MVSVVKDTKIQKGKENIWYPRGNLYLGPESKDIHKSLICDKTKAGSLVRIYNDHGVFMYPVRIQVSMEHILEKFHPN